MKTITPMQTTRGTHLPLTLNWDQNWKPTEQRDGKTGQMFYNGWRYYQQGGPKLLLKGEKCIFKNQTRWFGRDSLILGVTRVLNYQQIRKMTFKK